MFLAIVIALIILAVLVFLQHRHHKRSIDRLINSFSRELGQVWNKIQELEKEQQATGQKEGK